MKLGDHLRRRQSTAMPCELRATSPPRLVPRGRHHRLPAAAVRFRGYQSPCSSTRPTSSRTKHELLGQPVVPNGIPLSKIHHAAFDAHLIGVDADYRLHVSERLLSQQDGPMLEALKRLRGEVIHLPDR